MVKTLRVSDYTYSLIMSLVGNLQVRKRKKVSVDMALKEIITSKKTKKDPFAWDKLEKAMFKGPKTNCVEEIDLML